ncbi:hypothetical protein [Methanofollis fontis]|uniref:Chemotaxis methyl-accepting receptor HlyB-like 4HB MCP domain-containing protein n=1 Tax=Methanofollis fontis TaxID=2052832 RepID=A0A483CRH1_9EURY|nr:hypothetical protein [Methanofollis fontis]TAJ45713.1 hypothetical protein CUJ86_03095 [Methanofollis fontis]
MVKISLPKKIRIPKEVIIWCVIALLVVGLMYVGWNLYKEMDRSTRTTALNDAIGASQGAILPLNGEVSDLLSSIGDRPSTAECDAYMLRLRALADQGAILTAVHRANVASIDAPISSAGAQGAYLDALTHLHDAFTGWAAASDAYFRYDYDGARSAIADADLNWQAYLESIGQYRQYT